MFKSQASRVSRLPHLATAFALVFTIALGLMQPASGGAAAATSTASVMGR